MEISFTTTGSFKNTEKLLKGLNDIDSMVRRVLSSAAQQGVLALQKATPKDSGLAASSWGYKIVQNGRKVSIVWLNRDVESGFPVAIMLQYGYATGTGGYVQGRDYINPAMRPLFDKIADDVWKAVKSL